MTRPVIASLIAALLFCMWLEKKPDLPPKQAADSIPYCVVTYKAAVKDPTGKWHRGWAKTYGPCSELDRYENV